MLVTDVPPIGQLATCYLLDTKVKGGEGPFAGIPRLPEAQAALETIVDGLSVRSLNVLIAW